VAHHHHLRIAADAGFVVRDVVRDRGTASLARGTTAARQQ